MVGEPLLLTTGIMVLWTMTNMTHGSDIGIIPFALTGYSFITLWRHIVSEVGARHDAERIAWPTIARSSSST